MKVIFFLFIFFLVVFFRGYAQDKDLHSKEQIDTIIIHKDPFVINKSIIVEEPVLQKSKWWAEVSVVGSKYFSHYSVCKNCESYYEKIRQATKVKPGTAVGINLSYVPGKTMIVAGLSFASYKEMFHQRDNDLSIVNRFNYLETIIGLGYLFTTGKISSGIVGGIGFSTLLKYSGSTYAFEDPSHVVSLTDEKRYNSHILNTFLSYKMMYELSDKFKIVLEPFYKFDLTSVLHKKGPFTLQRNNFGIKTGIIFSI